MSKYWALSYEQSCHTFDQVKVAPYKAETQHRLLFFLYTYVTNQAKNIG